MQCSATERCLGLLTTLRPGEGRSVILFFGYAFLLLTCYYVLKLLREPLLLVTGSAELKSYAYAAIALVLMLLVPVYGAVFRRTAKGQLVRWVTGFFLTSLMLFYVLGRAGLDIGFAYYVWVGVFGVTMLAQFWAHAAHSFDVQSGQRLFPVVMAGATLGALAGPPLVGALFPLLGPWNLMLVAMALLAATLPLVASTGNSVPAASRNPQHDVCAGSGHVLSGFALVMRDRYLLLLALLMVLLNCVNTTGEYILTELVIRHADYELVTQPGLDKGSLIAAFYGDFYFAVNALTVVLQVLLVARVFRWIGVHGAILVLPIIAIIGYGLIVFLPIFSIIRAVKIIENGVDYSMMNTARHALYLPLPAAHQYEGKTAIDTFFWRLGDVLQAGVIYVGLNWFGFEFQQFAVLNMVLASVWIVVAMQIARRYAQRIPSDTRRARRGLVVRFSAAALGLAAFAVSADAAADRTLFAEHEVLQIELVMDTAAFCRNPQRKGCGDAPASLVYKAADGREQHIDVSVRARGRWRQDTAACRLPALFVFFSESAASGTPFAGEKMLPLTTHCRETPSAYEQYVLKEYLAYRIYNLLTDKSLRVRLARITYRDTGSSESTQRYGFFTEHFDSLAARHDAQVWRPDEVDLRSADSQELAGFALFQYMIGNTDWSAVYSHNIVSIRDPDGSVTAVPYDFDFSGLVDAEYAGPPPKLPLRSVTQRLFRGSCQPSTDWAALFEHFQSRRAAIAQLADEIPDLRGAHHDRALAYLASFFDVLDSPERRRDRIIEVCHPLHEVPSVQPHEQ